MLPCMGSLNVTLLEALLSAGVAPERARAVVDQFDRAVDERYSLHAQVLATRRDVAEVHAALARELADVRAAVARDLARVEAAIAEQRAQTAREIAAQGTALTREIASLDTRLTREIARTKVDLVKWALSALTAQTALLLGASKLV